MKKDIERLVTRVSALLAQEHGITLASAPSDATLSFRNTSLRVSLIVQRHLSGPAMLFPLIEAQKRSDVPLILITEHLSAESLTALRTAGIWAADAAGNLFIEHENFCFLIAGRKDKTPRKEELRGGRAFLTAGTRVLFTLLTDPAARNTDLRSLARRSGVSLGAVGPVLADLETTRLLVSDGKERKLTDLARLRERWVTAYGERLRPKLSMGTYRPLAGPIIESSGDLFFGGASAAELLGLPLAPTRTTLYTTADATDLIKRFKLVPDPNGPVELLCFFWDSAWFTGTPEHRQGVVPYLLIYADLLLSGSERNFEAARSIHERYLAPLQ